MRVTDDSLRDPTAPPGLPRPAPGPPAPPAADASVEPASSGWADQVTPRRVFWWAVAAALGVLVVYLGALFVYGVRDLLVLIIVAAFITMSLDPLVRWLIRHKVRRPYAVTIIFLLFFIVLGLVIWLAVPPLVRQATQLATDFPGFLDTLRERSPALRDLEGRFNLKTRLDEFGKTFIDRIQDEALAFGQRFLGALIQALLVIVLTIYFMADLPRIRRAIVRIFPARSRPQVSHAVNVTIDKVGAYMIGNLLISFIAGVTTYLVLELIGVPFALPLAVFVAVTDLIPLIGATLGAVVCTIVAIATSDLWPEVILTVIFFVAYQQLENYLIAPMVLRNTVDMSSIAVLLAALLGGSVLGLIGALMAIPVAAVVKVLLTPRLEARDAAAIEAGAAPPGG
jgi:predicted PurR-regulated permease PerM